MHMLHTVHRPPVTLPLPPWQAMFRDIKLNTMQHSVGKLREMLAAFNYWPADGKLTKHEFRAPQKPPKWL